MCGKKHSPSLPCPQVNPPVTPPSVFYAGGPTYSLACKVTLYHESDKNRNNSVEGLALIDNGSGVTLISSKVTDPLKFPHEDVSSIYLPLHTIDGPCGNPSRSELSNICISPASNPEVELKLQGGVSTEMMLSTYREVRTRREVSSIPEFKGIQSSFPEEKEQMDTIILIGRNNVWAKEYEKQLHSTEPNAPLAVQTRLGWALMGPKVRPPQLRDSFKPRLRPAQQQVLRVSSTPECLSPVIVNESTDPDWDESAIIDTQKETKKHLMPSSTKPGMTS